MGTTYQHPSSTLDLLFPTKEIYNNNNNGRSPSDHRVPQTDQRQEMHFPHLINCGCCFNPFLSVVPLTILLLVYKLAAARVSLPPPHLHLSIDKYAVKQSLISRPVNNTSYQGLHQLQLQ